MKKIIIMVLSAFIFLTSCSTNHHDFKSLDFGMSSDKIIESEGEPANDYLKDGIMEYNNQTVFGLSSASITYFLENGSLKSIKISYQTSADTWNNDIAIIKNEMVKIYGDPITSEETLYGWHNGFLSGNENGITILLSSETSKDK